MKKFIFLSAFLIFAGCADKQNVTGSAEDVKQTLLDRCTHEKILCEAKCKIDYIKDNWKYKACIAKCYTVFGACKTGKTIKKGYEKTKEFIKENLKD